MANYLVNVFEDTQKMIVQDPVLQEQMQNSQRSSQLYLEGYVSPVRKVKSARNVEVVENTTFQCAREHLPQAGKIAVLNFANPHNPGGGVRHGAMAQEECLCRCSDLYNVLAQPYFKKHFYQYHYRNCGSLCSDRLIYSPSITVFKSDDTIPQKLDEPFFVDVITCAAPYLDGYSTETNDTLMDIYRSRIRNILEVAISKDVDILILGAFGCGVFHNDPALMSNAFSQLLIKEGYAQFYEKVVFAIKSTGSCCPNLYAFREAFRSDRAKEKKRSFWPW